MTYLQQYQMLSDAPFRGRVMMAMLTAANNIVNEDPGTADHTARVALATAVLGDPQVGADGSVGQTFGSHVNSFVYACAANATIAAAGPVDSPDGDLDFVIASVWTARALEFAA